MEGHGYDRVQPPLIEFETSLASRMDGVRPRRMFRFVDPASLRTLALRSDITPQVGRIAATGLAGAPRPLRLCYAGQVLTIAGDGLDPPRERLQVGAELIGADSVAAAGEIVSHGDRGGRPRRARPASRSISPCRTWSTRWRRKPFRSTPEQVEAVRRELDAKDAGGLKDAGGAAYLPLLYAAGPFDEAVEKLAAIDAGGALAQPHRGPQAKSPRGWATPRG